MYVQPAAMWWIGWCICALWQFYPSIWIYQSSIRCLFINVSSSLYCLPWRSLWVHFLCVLFHGIIYQGRWRVIAIELNDYRVKFRRLRFTSKNSLRLVTWCGCRIRNHLFSLTMCKSWRLWMMVVDLVSIVCAILWISCSSVLLHMD